MMRTRSILRLGWLVTVFGLLIGACVSPGRGPETPHGTATHAALSVEGGSLQLIEAKIQRSYQTHYLMIYPPDDQRFLQVNVAMEGIDEAESWLQSSLLLLQPGARTPATHVRRRLVGTDYSYRVGEDFSFVYELFYPVESDFDPDAASLSLPSGLTMKVASLLTAEPGPAATTARVQVSGTVLSGEDNIADGPRAVVGGGSGNRADATHSVVSGGQLNAASAAHAAVGGGRENQASSFFSAIGGGFANLAAGRESTVAGGSRNSALGRSAAVTGGVQNAAEADASTVGGGENNLASGVYAGVFGGIRNTAAGNAAVIAGGAGNAAEGDQGTVGGGLDNKAAGSYSTVSGGLQNQASGRFSLVPGGAANTAAGDYSFAVGHRAIVAAEHPGAFVFSDSTDLDFRSNAPDEFAVRATGGVRLISAVSGSGSAAAGVLLPAGSGSWSMLSDRASKADFAAVDPNEVLRAVAKLPILSWRYQTQPQGVRHIGPTSQDFATAFHLGEDDRHISSIDADGVALAAIQALAGQVRSQEDQLEEDGRRLDVLESQVEQLTAERRADDLRLGVLLLASAACGSLATLIASRRLARRDAAMDSAI